MMSLVLAPVVLTLGGVGVVVGNRAESRLGYDRPDLLVNVLAAAWLAAIACLLAVAVVSLVTRSSWRRVLMRSMWLLGFAIVLIPILNSTWL